MSGYVTERTVLTNVQTADITNDAVTLAKLAGGTDGNLITYDTSGDPAAVTVGTATHVLTSAGAGAVPTFKVTTSPIDLRLMFLLIAENAGDRLNMVDGIVDPFKDESDIDTSTSSNEAYSSSSDLYTADTQQGEVSYSGSANIGDMTAGGGLAAAFDDDKTQNDGESAQKESTTDGYVGKDWGSGNTKTLTGVKCWGASGNAYTNDNNGTVTLEVWGSASAPTSSTNGTKIATIVTNRDDSNGIDELEKLTGFTTSTAYRYHWFTVDPAGPKTDASNCYLFCAELEFYDDVSGDPENITLVSNAFTADSAPDTGRIHIQAKPIDSITINTDLTAEISRNGGTTFTAATLVAKETLADGTIAYEDNDVDISGQSSAVAMKWRIKTLNNKDIELHGVVLQWA